MFERHYFVIAPNFHGATLLAKLLNDHPEVMSLGDTYPSNRIDQVCGCGKVVSQCAFWQQVAVAIGADRYRFHPHWLPNYPGILGGGKDRLLYNMLSLRGLSKMIPATRQEAFTGDFIAFTSAIQAYGGRKDVRVFVDGVKSISRVAALAACGVRIDGVIHLQRNPGDFIQSTLKAPGFSRRDFVRQLVNYRLFHNRARRIGREFPYMSLTYEGLAESPESTLDSLFQFIGVESFPLSTLLDGGRKRPWHFMGNASLFNFDGHIRRSLHSQTLSERVATRVLAGPYDARLLHLAGNSV